MNVYKMVSSFVVVICQGEICLWITGRRIVDNCAQERGFYPLIVCSLKMKSVV